MQETYVSPQDIVDPNQLKSQDDIEHRMLVMQEPIRYWEDILAVAHDEGDKDAELQLAQEAIEHLDKMWGYAGEKFFVAGTWKHAVPDFEAEASNEGSLRSFDGSLRWTVEDVDVCQEAISRGVAWTSVDTKPRLCYMFNLEVTEISMPFLQMTIEMQAAALPEKISLMHISEYTPDDNEEKEAELKRFLIERDQLIRRCLSREEFLRLSHKEQRGLVEGLVEDTYESILEPGSEIAISFDCSYAYEQDGRGVRRVENDDLLSTISELPITGIILGVGVIEEPILKTRPLRRKADFLDYDAGLCVIVETLFNDNTTRLVKVPLHTINLDEADIQLY